MPRRKSLKYIVILKVADLLNLNSLYFLDLYAKYKHLIKFKLNWYESA